MMKSRIPSLATRAVALAFAVVALGALACQGRTGDTGGETHWQKGFLAACVSDSHCEAPFTCVRNMCTRPCSADDGCDVDAGELCDPEGRCVVPERAECTSAEACTPEHEGWMCDETALDACRSTVAVCRAGAWIEGSLDVCRGALVETFPASEAGPETVIVKRSETDAAMDLLVVVDDSSSALVEQTLLGERFPGFVAGLAARGVGDFRIAVTTTDVQCSPTPEHAARGRFSTHPVTALPVSAGVSVSMACADDDACDASACDILGCSASASWRCERPLDACLENPNGSFNSKCILGCSSDADCNAVLGDGHRCLRYRDGYCVPDTMVCPDSVGPVLAGDSLPLAGCAVRVGRSDGPCATVEQPLEAMRLALDPAGENAAQAAAFLRPNAVLGVVVVSDEEDCSTAPGHEVGEQDWDRCGLVGSVDDGGPLQTVAHYVDFLTRLKPPGRVFFAAVAGDSTAVEPSAIAADRAAYLASKAGPLACNAATTICTSSDRTVSADYSGRILSVVDALAPNSHAANICSDDWEAVIDDLGRAIGDTATRFCLPRAPTPAFSVERAIGGSVITVSEGSGPGTWQPAREAPECASGVAVVVFDAPVAGERLRFVYR